MKYILFNFDVAENDICKAYNTIINAKIMHSQIIIVLIKDI